MQMNQSFYDGFFGAKNMNQTNTESRGARKGIWIADHTGDQLLCVDGTTNGTKRVRAVCDSDEAVEVSAEALSAFFDDCINRYGYHGLAVGRPAGSTEFEALFPAGRKVSTVESEKLRGIEEVLVAMPLVGG